MNLICRTLSNYCVGSWPLTNSSPVETGPQWLLLNASRGPFLAFLRFCNLFSIPAAFLLLSRLFYVSFCFLCLPGLDSRSLAALLPRHDLGFVKPPHMKYYEFITDIVSLTAYDRL